MYDKLGELLSNALESGIFLSEDNKESSENNINSTKKCTDKQFSDGNNEINNKNTSKSVYNFIQPQTTSSDCIVTPVRKLIKYAHPDIQIACTFVGVTDEMTFDEAKKLFHTKLQRYHPDKNADNPVMKKITFEKTNELLKAWKLIEDWYKS